LGRKRIDFPIFCWDTNETEESTQKVQINFKIFWFARYSFSWS